MKSRSVLESAKRSITVPVVIAFLCGGIVFGIVGWYAPSPLEASKYLGGVLLQSSNFNNYKYIDPLLACEIGTEDAFTDLAPLKAKLSSLVNRSVAGDDAENVSIYFRSLKTAHWLDINPDVTYAPASLLKVFVMMAFYKESRDLNDPNMLNRQIPFKGSPNAQENDTPGAVIPHLVNDQLYTINDVIKQMIVYSDNDALNTLTDNFDPQTSQSLSEIFSDLKIPSALSEASTYEMSVDQYAMIFRVLYGSTYLSRRLSEQALNLLAQAQFKYALAGGVPPDVAVAHKFGIAVGSTTATSADASKELHDCGIVYYPQNPYVLCVMTRGNDFTKLTALIQNISKEAYEEMQTMRSDSD